MIMIKRWLDFISTHNWDFDKDVWDWINDVIIFVIID